MLSLLATSVVFKDNAQERQRLTFFVHPCRFIIAKEDGKNSQNSVQAEKPCAYPVGIWYCTDLREVYYY